MKCKHYGDDEIAGNINKILVNILTKKFSVYGPVGGSYPLASNLQQALNYSHEED